MRIEVVLTEVVLTELMLKSCAQKERSVLKKAFKNMYLARLAHSNIQAGLLRRRAQKDLPPENVQK